MDPSAPAPELDLSIDPSVIERGASALLTWEARHAERVDIDHNIGTVDTVGRIRFFPDETTTYQVTAAGRGGAVTGSVTVEVVEKLDRPAVPSVSDLDRRTLEEQFNDSVKPVFFNFDSAELTAEARLTLDGNVRWLSQPENRRIRFVIEGHCDERGSEEYNLALGDKRAQVVRQYLIEHGLADERILAVSLGEERPLVSGSTEDAHALNRRAQFVLMLEAGPADNR